MNVKSAKRIVAKKLNVGTSKVKISTDASKKIKEAITGQDLESLIKEGTFTKRTNLSQSMGRARILKEKKKKGRKSGKGTRRGKKNARQDLHALWIMKIRAQRKYILTLLSEQKIDKVKYRDLYNKAKGGFFRSKSHIDSYLSKK
jgi:large subunit ribosomal protein L19e